jgi:hypothetical protein
VNSSAAGKFFSSEFFECPKFATTLTKSKDVVRMGALRGDEDSWFPTLAPEKKRKDGARKMWWVSMNQKAK